MGSCEGQNYRGSCERRVIVEECIECLNCVVLKDMAGRGGIDRWSYCVSTIGSNEVIILYRVVVVVGQKVPFNACHAAVQGAKTCLLSPFWA